MSEARPAGLALRALASAAHAVTAMLEPRLSVLIFHRVNATRDPIFPGDPHAASFEAMLRLVASCFTVIPLHEAVQGLERGTLPRGALAITFDDGYADNATVALPILARLGLPATFFVAAGFIDGGRMFNDVVIESVRAFAGTQCDLGPWGRHDVATPAQKAATIAALIGRIKHLAPAARDDAVADIADRLAVPRPPSLMMTSAQVRALSSAGMDVGGHTLTHPILARIPAADAEREIAAGREALEGLTRAPVRMFAYPNGTPRGDYGAEHVAIVRRLGFSGACSTAVGVARRGADSYQVPRFTPWDAVGWKFGLRLLHNLSRTEYATA